MNILSNLYYRYKKILKTLRLYLIIAGPGIIVMVADNDAGGITTYTATGAQYGFYLIWFLILLGPIAYYVQEMTVRLSNRASRHQSRMGFVCPVQARHWFKRLWSGVFLLMLVAAPPLLAQDGGQGAASANHQRWDLHFQSTLIGQGVPPFRAAYSGTNSLEPHGEVKDTFSFDVTGNVQLWHGGEFSADVLVWQGYGLSKTTGVAGFPNGEALRLGKTYGDAFVSRAYFRQTLTLGGGANQNDASRAARQPSRLTLMAGHLPAIDVFDKNAYANDPRTQFMNWALMENPAWDFAANSLGYTNGAAVDLELRSWGIRWGVFQVPRTLNGMRMDWNLAQAHSLCAELERDYAPAGHPGAARLLAYRTRAHMGNYDLAFNIPGDIQPQGQLGYRSKYGFGINLEQEIRKNFGAFARLGWSDGQNGSWMNTDVDRTASVGVSLKGETWRRSKDTAGFGVVVNGVSAAHRQFLARGGLGITVGDGRLDYGREGILEAYYSLASRMGVSISPDFQFVAHPAYNRDRGPVSIFALRFHWER